MPGLDFSYEAGLWQRLLSADGICFWRNDADGVAIPVGCAPESWIDTGFLIERLPGRGWQIETGATAAERLPLALAAGLPAPPAALLIASCAPSGGLLALWQKTEAVPAAIDTLAELVCATCARLLDLAEQADYALDTHLQMHSLVAALPQGVIIVPNRSRRGFVNEPAARWLALPAGEVDVGTLAVRLSVFAERAVNAAEVTDYLRPHLSAAGKTAVQRTCIWRFSQVPQALRVTVAPIGEGAPAGWVWLLDDISAEELARDQLRQREAHFRLFFQSLQQDAVVYTDRAGRLIEWNEPFRQLLGYSDAALATLRMADLVDDGEAVAAQASVARELAAQGYSKRREKRLRRADGRLVPVESRSIVRADENGEVTAVWEVLHDIAERKAAEAQLLLAAQAFHRADDGVLLLSPQLTVVTANDAFLNMSGYTREALVGHDLAILQSSRQDAHFYASLRETLAQQGRWRGEVWQRRQDGGMFLKWLSLSPLRSDDGRLTHYLAMFRDPAVEKEAHARLEYLATHDELTRLPNRMLFDDRFQLALSHAGKGGRQLALLMVDLDDFKAINDSFGHTVGDRVLCEAARRLAQRLRPVDTLARWGGDEFAVLADIESAEEVAALCTDLLNDLAQAHAVAGWQAWLPACIGVSIFPQDGRDAETLVRKADTALHRAKSHGKNTYRFFTDDMAEQARRQLRLESDLRHALNRGELFLMYQPQIEASSGRLAGCEALVRWHRADETVSPSVFIPAAEKSGLIIELTDWALGEAFQQIATWAHAGIVLDSVSINTSARHFRLDNMVGRVTALAHRAGVAPQAVCLEITEGVLMDAEHSEAVLNDLKAAGFHVSVDDFGTGYSSLSYLKRFPIDELKIDKSFVDGIESASSDRAIIAATLTMAHSLGMRVVAEGVENGRQQDYLKARHCDLIQGYLHSRPLSAADFQRFANARRA